MRIAAITIIGLLVSSAAVRAVETLEPAALTATSFTTTESGVDAFSLPAPPLTAEQIQQFVDGRAQFSEPWGVMPKPTVVWGLGPVFNEDNCVECHERNGRARGPVWGQVAQRGTIVRLSVAGRNDDGGPLPHPVYGDQLQTRAILGVPAEGQALFTYEMRKVAFADGDLVELRVPKVEFARMNYGEIGPETMYSPRIAPAMIGLGLLDAVAEETVLAIAAGQAHTDAPGKPNYVWDYEQKRRVLGRFGWKANQSSLRQQTAAALHNDLGATTTIFIQENCTSSQVKCRDAPSASKCSSPGNCNAKDRPEALPSRVANIEFYLRALAVPARRNLADPAVKRGETLFAQARCTACHVPEMKTSAQAAMAAAADLAIHPYTDLLLHDMGDDLADGRGDFEATGREWRTAPLWGIGLLKTVNAFRRIAVATAADSNRHLRIAIHCRSAARVGA
ncbi:MAG: di-heme oxidoredictase family protein, partial [Betaproteobacteria bacterium]